MKRQKKIKALLIGAGETGAMLPEKIDGPETANVLTVAHAIRLAGHDIQLDGIVDIDGHVAMLAGRRWQAKHFKSLEDVLITDEIDLIAICTPPSAVGEILNYFYKRNVMPKAIILKDPGWNWKEIDFDNEYLLKKGSKIFLAYPHRYCLKNVPFPDNPLFCTGIYTHGHFGGSEVWTDFLKCYISGDPELSTFEIENENLSMFDVRIISEKTILHITENMRSFSVSDIGPDAIFNERNSEDTPKKFLTNYATWAFVMVNECIAHIRGFDTPDRPSFF